jgi:hypothetical protein
MGAMRPLLVAALALLTACFEERTEFPSGVIRCSREARACPTGLTCGADNLCWRLGALPPDAPVGLDASACAEGELQCVGGAQHQCAGGTLALVTTCENACVGGYCVECEPATRRCDGTRPQLCGDTGSWSSLSPCPAATPQCDDGACLPPCTPVGARRCARDGLAVQECDLSGQFRTVATCMFVCVEGSQAACGGECRPDSARCGADHTAETCALTGEWVSGEPCAGVCVSGRCEGECRPGATRCGAGGLALLETCGADGRWGPPSSCTFVCDVGTDRCGGVCTPGARRCNGSRAERCGDDGAWALDADCGDVPCTHGSCGPCTDGDTGCNADVPQRCEGGAWTSTQEGACPFVCDRELGCVGECVPGTSTCAGDTRRVCGVGGLFEDEACPLVCVDGQCAGSCQSGTLRCNGDVSQQCNSTGEWSGGTSCAYGCDGATGDCLPCVAEPVETTCAEGGCGQRANNCGDPVACPDCTGPG